MAEKWLRRGGKIVTAGSDFGFVQEGADAAVKRASEVIASL
jgi:hypothetical protein